MEIYADSVRVDGLHHPLLRETSLRVSDGQVALVAGEPGEGHTAFALVLSGRLEPNFGDVLLDGSPNTRALRARVAPVDVPGVSAPEPSLVLSHVVAEELVMAGVKARKSTVHAWLDAREASKYYDAQIGLLPPSIRIRILTDLAAARRNVRALVLALPDRHGGRPEFWWRTACHYADQGFAVVVLCTETSARQLGIEPHHLGTPDGKRPTAASTTTVVLADSSQLAIAARKTVVGTGALALPAGSPSGAPTGSIQRPATTADDAAGARPWADLTEDDELEPVLDANAPLLPGPSVRPGVFGQPDAPPDIPDVLPPALIQAADKAREKAAAKAAGGTPESKAERKQVRRARRQARQAEAEADGKGGKGGNGGHGNPSDPSGSRNSSDGGTSAPTEPMSTDRSTGGT